MAKRKLLNSERDIILSKCLNKTFHPALQKIDKEYEVINTKFINWYKNFTNLLTGLDYEKCKQLSDRSLITSIVDMHFEKRILIKDDYYSTVSKKHNADSCNAVAKTVKEAFKIANVLQFSNYTTSFDHYPCYVGKREEFTNQSYAQAVTVYIKFRDSLPSFNTGRFSHISNIVSMPQFNDDDRSSYQSIMEEYAVLQQKLNQVFNDITELYHKLKAQLKAIPNAETLQELLPVAYSFLPPIEEREPTTRQSATKALMSYGAIAHLNGLLTKGYQL